jgi:hypothetical protein
VSRLDERGFMIGLPVETADFSFFLGYPDQIMVKQPPIQWVFKILSPKAKATGT